MCICACMYAYKLACILCVCTFLAGWTVMGSLGAVIAVLAGVVIAILLTIIYVQWTRYIAN